MGTSGKAAWIARRREAARAAGLCVTCCKRATEQRYSVCKPCSNSATQRTARRRAKQRALAESLATFATHEVAGDRASEKHFYKEAAEYYKDALNVARLQHGDLLRIWEKIGRALFLSDDPDAANPWFSRVLDAYLADSKDVEKSVEILFQIARQLTNDCKYETALAALQRAVQIAQISTDTRLHTSAVLRLINALEVSERNEEAIELLSTVKPADVSQHPELQSFYLSRCAVAEAVMGHADMAFTHFEAALKIAKSNLDSYRSTVVWDNYAAVAWELGDSNRSKACCEQALFVARRDRIDSRIPVICLNYADILFSMGEYQAANVYLLEALSYDTWPRGLQIAIASIGIPIALQSGDTLTLTKCTLPKTIDFAFQSGSSGTIAAVARAFTRFYISQGRLRDARALLHRALVPLHRARYGPDFFIEIARFGSFPDIAHARSLLVERMRLPSNALFVAGLALFDAFAEQRHRNAEGAASHAREAIERFEALQLYGCSELARSILPAGPKLSPRKVPNAPFSHMQLRLTPREADVESLVLKGLTNREIADALAITPHTVEKHMNSIMNRLGIRSRYQIADVLDHQRQP